MEPKHAFAKVRLSSGGGEVEVDALFDTGAPRSIISEDLAAKLKGGILKLPFERQYILHTARAHPDIAEPDPCGLRVTATVNANVETAGCRIPATTFEVSPDLRPGHLIIGRTQLDDWDIEFAKDGPKPRKCPAEMEIMMGL